MLVREPLDLVDMLLCESRFQDAGQELRRPLSELWGDVQRTGYKFVVQHGLATNLKCCGPVGELTADGARAVVGRMKRLNVLWRQERTLR